MEQSVTKTSNNNNIMAQVKINSKNKNLKVSRKKAEEHRFLSQDETLLRDYEVDFDIAELETNPVVSQDHKFLQLLRPMHLQNET